MRFTTLGRVLAPWGGQLGAGRQRIRAVRGTAGAALGAPGWLKNLRWGLFPFFNKGSHGAVYEPEAPARERSPIYA